MRICPQCGKQFKPINESHVYCVKQCRYDFNNARKQKTQSEENRVYTQLHGGVTIPDGYVLVPKKDWDRLLQMVTDIAMNRSEKKDQTSHGEVLPSIPYQKPLVTDDDDMPMLTVTKSAKKDNYSENFMNSFSELFGGS